jgi:hypothetical protein
MLALGCKSKSEASASTLGLPETEPPSQPSPSLSKSEPAEEASEGSAKSAEVVDTQSELVPRGHQYYGVYVQGQKAGWAQQRVTSLPDGGTELWMKVIVRLARGDHETGMELLHINRYGPGPTGLLREISLEQTLPDGAKSTHHGVLEKSGFVMTVSAGGKTSRTVIEAPKETANDSVGAYLVPRLLQLGEGKTVVTHQFDPMTQRSIPIETTLTASAEKYMAGGMVTVLDVDGIDRVRGLKMRTRFAQTGMALEMVLGPGFKLVLEEKALAQDKSQGAPDLYRLSRVPIDTPIGRATEVKYLVVELDGLSPDVKLNDARQNLVGNRLEIKRLEMLDVPIVELTEAQQAHWLRATPFVDHESPTVRRLLKSITEKDIESRLRRMNSAVHRAIRYTLATAPLSASSILKEARGDCTEYTLVLVALLRSAGIPAREVSGLAYAGDGLGFAFHAWAEAYIDGRWIALDPTWNQFPIDATHIALSRDDPSPIVGMLGGVSLRLVERK